MAAHPIKIQHGPSILGDSKDLHGPTVRHSLFLYQRDILAHLLFCFLPISECDLSCILLYETYSNTPHASLGHHFEQYHMYTNLYMTRHSLASLRPQFKFGVHLILNVNFFFLSFRWSLGSHMGMKETDLRVKPFTAKTR